MYVTLCLHKSIKKINNNESLLLDSLLFMCLHKSCESLLLDTCHRRASLTVGPLQHVTVGYR